MNIVFASGNLGKIRELQEWVKPWNIQIIPQNEKSVAEIPETGCTFVENALLKARHASRQTGMPAIADDSGLLVDALHGAPGLFSARFAGEKAGADANINKVLTELTDVPMALRQAHFYCVLVYLQHAEDPTPIITEGAWHGMILTERQGQAGFGYDPIFFDPNENMTAAELPLAKKNLISHRAQAMSLLLKKLPQKM